MMKINTTILRLLVITACVFFFEAKAQKVNRSAGFFEAFSDIGSPAIKGTSAYDPETETYRISGSGSNIWFGSDKFSFLYRKMKGNFIVQTQFRFLGAGHELHRKTGIMIRSSADSNAALVACTVHGDGLTSLQYRNKPGANIKEIKFKISAPDVLQLEKHGNTYTMSVAHFGEVYQVEKMDSLELGNELMAGLFICAHTDKFSEEAEFHNTRIFNTAPDDLVQYRTYLGSLLETMDVVKGHRKVLASADISLQAPNWTPDGKSLICNSLGKLHQFDIETRASKIINTDFADKNNNDHVLTFDGKFIGISDQSQQSKGQSAIYSVPVTGGIPKRITEKTPSYFHGWSPDSQYLLYTAERNGEYDIYKISKNGGPEFQLTNSKGLDDGSEYSPDGKFIYFCSTRSGNMQIWRMGADGQHQVQLTFDEMNNWFPHVSPDNKWLVFLSFDSSVPADSHPFYKKVYLRMMPVNGGVSKVIAYLYGGQGTINVPSWSPDSKKIAFVSNGIFN